MVTPAAGTKPSLTTPTRNELAPQAKLAAWHTLSIVQAIGRLQADAAHGLTPTEASRRLAQSGPNTLSHAHHRSALSIFVSQFYSLIVALLLVATAIAFAIGDH